MDILFDVLNSVLSLVVILTVIVFVHEYGHYIVGRWCGVKALEFSIGFGRKLCSFVDKRGTEWKICMIPLGGYVKFLGDVSPTSTEAADLDNLPKAQKKYAFASQNMFKKSAIVTAGPAANFLLAIAIFMFFFYVYGKPVATNEVLYVQENSVAFNQGIKPGDAIVAIDGDKFNSFLDIDRHIKMHPGVEMEFTIERKGETLVKKITPESVHVPDNADKNMYIGRIGVATNVTREKVGLGSSFIYAADETYKLTMLNLKAIKEMIVGTRSTKDISSVIKISRFAGESTKLGAVRTLSFIALLSIGLGLMNILPIPPLDGGHLLLYVIKAVFGNKVYMFSEKYLVKAGMAFIIALMIFAVINDIIHF